ncbi:MAG: hypothetical protein FWG74_05685 [Planctomycetes bacterium]|nr:hypothetical protein [Planctomycetota bacterium]
MAETVRQRPVEYYNPRPLILGICFFWGVIMGFCLYLVRAPEQVTDNRQEPQAGAVAVPSGMHTDLERRRMDAPSIAVVEPAPAVDVSRLTLESIQLDPPPAILTTEGGLTGKNARPLGAAAVPQPPRNQVRPGTLPPPPLPELMP